MRCCSRMASPMFAANTRPSLNPTFAQFRRRPVARGVELSGSSLNPLVQEDSAFGEYKVWLNETIRRDFHGLDPFNQTACLVHQRKIFAEAGFPTHDWDIIINGSVGSMSAANCIVGILLFASSLVSCPFDHLGSRA